MQIQKDRKTAILLGATGLVGSQLLLQLLEHPAYQKVIVLSRRKPALQHAHLEVHLVDFDSPADFAHLLKGEDLFCALGTTLKKAGSRAAFFKVDFTYTREVARAARQNGVAQLLLVSAVGASPHSLFFYPRVKGELEQALKKLDFWAFHIFQPSVLMGKRKEVRFGEEIAGIALSRIDRLTQGALLKSYRPVDASTVANAMLVAAQQLQPGVHVHSSDDIHQLAEEPHLWITKQ
ncbi:MAG: NAD(P)H-binding protein [Saprospirales bacterium]|nr:NAD(P)H-binding protein [Saprospirales bacterium]